MIAGVLRNLPRVALAIGLCAWVGFWPTLFALLMADMVHSYENAWDRQRGISTPAHARTSANRIRRVR